MRTTVLAIALMAGLVLSGTATAQSRRTRDAVRGEADALGAIAGKGARYAVIVGEMRDTSSFAGGTLGGWLATSVANKLREMDGIAVVEANEATDKVRRAIERRGLPTLRLEGRVTSIEHGVLDGQTSLRCQVALMLMDEHGGALRSVVHGAATGVESFSRARLKMDKPLAERTLDGALNSAMNGMLQVLAGAARDASIAPPPDRRLALRR